MGKRNRRENNRREKVILPPELPPEISEDEIEVSDEDLQFVDENRDYAGFVSRLDTKSITKHVTRVADVKEDALEALYEKRVKRKALQKEQEESRVQVDPVDALPVKTSDGQLYYRTFSRTSEDGQNEDEAGIDRNSIDVDKSILRLTKTERREKLKKSKKEAKKQANESAKIEEGQETPQATVLAEVKEDLTAEESFENKKRKLAELGIELLADPESNIRSLKDMLEICKDDDDSISKLGLLSLLAVFKDIIPGYRIRLPTEKELEMKVSKEVKKRRQHESTLLSAYKAYLQRLLILEKKSVFRQVAVRCICTLLDAAPHFNFRESLLGAVVRNISSSDNVIRKLCSSTIKSLFMNEGKHGGEVTVEAVRLIAAYVKVHNCQLHPDSVEVLMSLSFDEDLGEAEKPVEDKKFRSKKHKRGKNFEEPKQLQASDRKKNRQELMMKMREEVAADYGAASLEPDFVARRTMQTETLSAVFETYFRILKHTMQSITSFEGKASSTAGTSGAHPLLAPCLNGLGKFSHLIDLDYIGDLLDYLKTLASGCISSDNYSEKHLKHLTVSERLQCCIIAFKVMRSNLDALNVDLHEFFIQLYNLILEYKPGRDDGGVFAEALKIMLCDDRQHDMQKAAAFIKRLATFALCFGSAESMAALVTLKHLLQKNIKCRNLLENDAGGGSVSGSIAKYHPYASDPNLSGALTSVLWELNLLSKHYHPAVSTMASGISCMGVAQNQAYFSALSPQEAFKDLSLERESFNQVDAMGRSNNKRIWFIHWGSKKSRYRKFI
ncbi:Nucleolar complex protein 3 isoform 1 [Tripterygium wilfordii]|uniref:Nucleolar complex protein 3 isoform 1 n=1 Tax=Tripterygium wilfordii TaxID=458696 RepID=A0A7J7C216_TRIWF|nr:Nucleolar complex protein 3 isoform 1 [Tripterygium wilfordii]